MIFFIGFVKRNPEAEKEFNDVISKLSDLFKSAIFQLLNSPVNHVCENAIGRPDNVYL